MGVSHMMKNKGWPRAWPLVSAQCQSSHFFFSYSEDDWIFKVLCISDSLPSLFLKFHERCNQHFDVVRMGMDNVTFLSCFVHLRKGTGFTE